MSQRILLFLTAVFLSAITAAPAMEQELVPLTLGKRPAVLGRLVAENVGRTSATAPVYMTVHEAPPSLSPTPATPEPPVSSVPAPGSEAPSRPAAPAVAPRSAMPPADGAAAAFARAGREVVIDLKPGARRSVSVQLDNESSADRELTLSVHGLSGLAEDSEWSCAGWLEVAPATLRLRAGQRRNVRLTASQPRTGAAAPFRYAEIVVTAVSGGKPAGETERIRVTVADRGAKARFGLSGRASLAQDERGAWTVTVRYENTGNALGRLALSGRLVDSYGRDTAAPLAFEPGGALLPGQTRAFDTLLDVTTLAPGIYSVELSASLERANDIQNIPVRISGRGNDKTLTVLATKNQMVQNGLPQ